MIKKSELLDLLKQCREGEERAIFIYTRHLNNVLFLAEFKNEDREKIRQILKTISEESEKHKELFNSLIKTVGESKQDVY